MTDVLGRKTGGRVAKVVDWDKLPPVDRRVAEYSMPFSFEALSANPLTFSDGSVAPVYRWGELYMFWGSGARYRFEQCKRECHAWRVWSSSQINQLGAFREFLMSGGSRRPLAIEDIAECAVKVRNFNKIVGTFALSRKYIPIFVLVRRSCNQDDLAAVKSLGDTIYRLGGGE